MKYRRFLNKNTGSPAFPLTEHFLEGIKIGTTYHNLTFSVGDTATKWSAHTDLSGSALSA